MKTKRFPTVVFICCMMAPHIHAQSSQNMFRDENLKGKVYYVHRTNGRDYAQTWFDKTGKTVRKEVKYGANPVRIYNYEYDSAGRLTSCVSYRTDSPNDKHTQKYTYNDRGLLESNGSRTYRYDERGNCVLEKTYDRIYIVRVFDDRNRVVEDYSPVRPPVEYADDDEKDEDGNVYEIDVLGAPNNVWVVDEETGLAYEETIYVQPTESNHNYYEYNERGDVSRLVEKTKDGELVEVRGIPYISDVTYRYDDKGNWIERSCSLYIYGYSALNEEINGPHVTRTITYYE